jgi:SAM-dependent methyltransferase/thioredoxin reductase
MMAGEQIKEQVRERYANAARLVQLGEVGGGCCGGSSGCGCGEPTGAGAVFGSVGYDADELATLPDGAVSASLGCGNPTALIDLHPGQTVLDLGSGGGIDVLLSARRVSPGGKAIGLDMTDEMLALARKNAAAAGVENVEFVKGEMEAMPLPDATVDVIISNCVVNLSPDKGAVLREAFRVLKPGGRFAISDVVTQGRALPAALATDMASWTGCIAGALEEGDYRAKLAAAGFVDVEVVVTQVYGQDDAEAIGGCGGAELYGSFQAEGGRIASAFVRATKPGANRTSETERGAGATMAENETRDEAAGGCGCGPSCCDTATPVAEVRAETGCCGDDCCGEETATSAEQLAAAPLAGDGKLPVAIIGAGPVGLAAAAHVLARGETPLVLEAGATVGAAIRKWGHVRLFSPWQYAIDPASRALLEQTDWTGPDLDAYPTGHELIDGYLAPLAATPALRPQIRLGARVTAIARQGFDKMKTAGRDEAPFVVQIADADGNEDVVLARAVIDASGTWESPNPLGANGLFAPGERAAAAAIHYGIPDALGAARAQYAGKRVVVVGSGHSAFNAVLDLATLIEEEGRGELIWAVRRRTLGQVFGGGENDALAERGKLGLRVRGLVERGVLRLVTGFKTARVLSGPDGVTLVGEDETLPPADLIVAATGFRPDLNPLRELRLDLDAAVESPTVLAPLIDPNLHSCGTVRPHGAFELKHPEHDFFIAGMKSYGRAPTFLMLTGYEQVRSIAAALAGDWAAARKVELVLPETGVCSSDRGEGADGGCCGTATGESSCGVPTTAPRGIKALPLAAGAGTLLATVGAKGPGGGCCG